MAFIKNKIFWIPIAILLIIIAVFVIGRPGLKSDNIHTVRSGSFELVLNSKGEIQGKNAVFINLPDDLKKNELRVYGLKIKDLIAEGSYVKKGDWVATLDAGTINQQMQSNQQDLDRRRAELNDAVIDSTIQLKQLRAELEEFYYDLEYKKLELEQAKFESPAYQRKKQVEYNKTLRQMDKKRRDYEIKRLELKTKTKRIEDRFNYYVRRDELLKKALIACQVRAPRDGMIMYAKPWGGRKLQIGDEVSRWNPAIATLPDMSVLVSETYVQEIDITKISVGDSVSIKVDALPNKIYTGKISKIANIGQELPGFDTKVFHVIIDLNENDKELKPAMTTDNSIILQHYDDVIKVPRECIFTNNGIRYVYFRKKGEIWRKAVQTGEENDSEVLIKSGLEEKDQIFISIPVEADSIPFYKG